ncbi:MAG: PmoA family protein [Saprospiraceae bacterium]|nr:PmoA family protein [Saprospiraceae bacterium]
MSSSIQLKSVPEEQKVDVLIDGQLFTAYRYPDEIAKPILYPILTTKGVPLTRGFPIDPQAGERVDHPHQVGHWLNYGNVNGLDFWNNKGKVPAERRHKYGRIVHKSIESLKQGKQGAQLQVATQWKDLNGNILLEESTSFHFFLRNQIRVIERVTTLTAKDTSVSFRDNKEGMFGIRVARALEFPSEKPLLLAGEAGIPNAAKIMDNEGVNGNYLSSSGQTGRGVWGTRAHWMKLHGVVAGEESSLVILDHPDNPGYPTYWHARDYGLFAANPLGQAIFSKGKESLNFSLEAGQSVKFKYQILVHSGNNLPAEEIEQLAAAFAKK